ncbi:MAG: hypothetical protein SVW57_13055 [Thermodesulfobacteriota bacterium]|nr:hypothetical protein [Thermodesulfobacteriota bacterium]
MIVLNLIIAIIALIVAILAYQRAGGEAEFREQIESLGPLREKTADLLAKLEKKVRKEENEENEDAAT